ncbi:hypothetical protein ACHHYP_13078 [Achlya hypogyna]|uniref:Transmembrane protein n=1 Tax=Achlya hypogyna TaxID=1202772 RepID=A0A1V9YG08_ACHHY|nr:hypothetical protein ACHHYP_13078 [Achlya hypogyna]
MSSLVTSLGLGLPLKLAADFSVIPSIYIMKRNQRHFEMFIGILHVVVSVCFNVAEISSDKTLFLPSNQWHNMLEVLWVAFLYLLSVHLLVIPSENVCIALRYTGFALAWIMKLKDGPQVHTHSLLLVAVAFSGVVLRRLVFRSPKMLPLARTEACIAVMLAAFCTCMYFYHPLFSLDPTYVRSLFYVCLGGFFFAGWKCVPSPELTAKKFDDCDIVFSNYS